MQQIRRSVDKDSPGTILKPGELAYSYLSGKLYIGAAESGNLAIPISFGAPVPSGALNDQLTITIE